MDISKIKREFSKKSSEKTSEKTSEKFSNGVKELEIKLLPTVGKFKLFWKCLESKSIKADKEYRVININVKPGDGLTKRKEIVMGDKRTETYNIKKFIAQTTIPFNTAGMRDAKLTMSIETLSSPFPIINAEITRLKHRRTIILKELPEWQFDLTMSVTLERKQFNLVRDLVKKLFVGDFEGSAFWNHKNVTFEIETEFLGDDIDEEKINTVIEFMKTCFFDKTIDVSGGFNYGTNEGLLYNLAKRVITKPYKQKQFGPWNDRPAGLKQMVNNPLSLTRSIYLKIYPDLEKYCVTDKADGDRCLVFLNHNGMQKNFILLGEKTINLNVQWSDNELVLDAEVILNNTKNEIKKIYIFDILLDGQPVADKIFKDRLEILKRIDFSGTPIELKSFYDLSLDAENKNYYADVFKKIIKLNNNYVNDGFILTPWNEAYFDMRVYKWKPVEHNTIDLLILDGKLFCGMKDATQKVLNYPLIDNYKEITKGIVIGDRYIPVQFSPPFYPLAYQSLSANDEKKVGEFRFIFDNDGNIEKAELIRIREDKTEDALAGRSYGNDYDTACNVFNNYILPLTLEIMCFSKEDLEKLAGQLYFKSEKTRDQSFIPKFGRFVKASVLKSIAGVENLTIVDLAAGKGQDIFTLNGLKFSKCLCVDFDANALIELNRRKYDFNEPRWYSDTPPRHSNHMQIFTMVRDLTKPAKEMLNIIESRYGILPETNNVVMLNFAIHYLLSDRKKTENVINTVSGLLAPGGTFFFTCFNGKKIYDLLKPIPEKSTYKFGEDRQIKRLYNKKDGIKFKTGLPISVMIPLSAGNFYNEYLVDIDDVISQFNSKGYSLIESKSFEDYEKDFPKTDQMSEIEKQFSRLYHVTIFRKLS